MFLKSELFNEIVFLFCFEKIIVEFNLFENIWIVNDPSFGSLLVFFLQKLM